MCLRGKHVIFADDLQHLGLNICADLGSVPPNVEFPVVGDVLPLDDHFAVELRRSVGRRTTMRTLYGWPLSTTCAVENEDGISQMNVQLYVYLARVRPLDANQLARRVPAAFADRPAARTSSKYVFLSTKTLIDGLFEAGFVAVAAIQTHSRRGSDPGYARHILRFQHPRESVTLVDAIQQ